VRHLLSPTPSRKVVLLVKGQKRRVWVLSSRIYSQAWYKREKTLYGQFGEEVVLARLRVSRS
jgi:hypothetical protein